LNLFFVRILMEEIWERIARAGVAVGSQDAPQSGAFSVEPAACREQSA
jgi:hypothetical protein